MYAIFNVFTNLLLHETGINLDARADMFNKLTNCVPVTISAVVAGVISLTLNEFPSFMQPVEF